MGNFCSVQGCTKTLGNRRTYCEAHYMRVYRTGSTDLLPIVHSYTNITGQQFGELTAIERDGNQWVCECSCGTRVLRKYSDLNRGRKRGAKPTCAVKILHAAGCYGTAHARVYELWGKASGYTCIDCGKQAAQWAYDHTDPTEQVDEQCGSYSKYPEFYKPLCVPCHKTFDLNRITITVKDSNAE